MKLWQKCPICDGAGNVSAGYFLRAGDYNQWTSDHTLDTCEICKGKGIIETPKQPDLAVEDFTSKW